MAAARPQAGEYEGDHVGKDEQPIEGETPEVDETELESTDGVETDDVDEEGESDEADEDELLISIGDEPEDEKDEFAGQSAPDWVKKVREENRELKRQLAAKSKETPEAPAKVDDPGPEPKLDDADVDYDAEKFAERYKAWMARTQAAKQAEAEARKTAEAATQQWQQRVEGYRAAGAALKVQGFAEAEAVVQDVLSHVQQTIILHGADRPEVVVYALGKNPGKAAELAKITDPVKFAFAVAKLEKDVKTTKKSAPPPERTIRGNTTTQGVVDSDLARLRKEAERTGDYSKVHAFRSQQREKTAKH